jgi:hypothetical protein
MKMEWFLPDLLQLIVLIVTTEIMLSRKLLMEAPIVFQPTTPVPLLPVLMP